ncbi:MAG: NAD(P)H-dependent oxidoreductase [Acidimicrobiales bacterium]
MKCLVVFAHPDQDSFGAALRDSVCAGLEERNHDVTLIDLYADGFDPVMDADTHRRYLEVASDHPDPLVARYIDLLREAEALVFVYPTWWAGLPAILKGWLDRVFLPGVAFRLGRHNKVRPNLRQVRRLIVVTTTGSPRYQTFLLTNAGKRTIMRTVRLVCSRRCRTTYLALDRLDSRTALERTDFLHEARIKVATI